uniref:MADF domain-containing protein n=1 Tax=Ditylenchus dipsaci TaxID=166011 RepID=A0A915EFJ3_9BILA
MSTSDDELFASPTKTSVEKPIKSLEEDSKADPILVKLIQEVKKERCLYDKSLKEYLNNTHKGPIWSRSRLALRMERKQRKSRICEMLCEADEEEASPQRKRSYRRYSDCIDLALFRLHDLVGWREQGA